MRALALKVIEARAEAETKAWAALAGYKFWMFGYHAAAWVKCNQLLLGSPSHSKSSPFAPVVTVAGKIVDAQVIADRTGKIVGATTPIMIAARPKVTTTVYDDDDPEEVSRQESAEAEEHAQTQSNEMVTTVPDHRRPHRRHAADDQPDESITRDWFNEELPSTRMFD